MMSSKISEKRDKKDPLRRSNTVNKLDSVPPLVAMLEVTFALIKLNFKILV